MPSPKVLWRAWSPWSLRRQMAREREDLHRFHVHLYCCNVQRELAEWFLTPDELQEARDLWLRQEAKVVERATAWNA